MKEDKRNELNKTTLNICLKKYRMNFLFTIFINIANVTNAAGITSGKFLLSPFLILFIIVLKNSLLSLIFAAI